jgi:hypothetical protein
MIDEETEFVKINMAEGFSVAWKRRWEIIFITAAAVILAVIASFLLPKAWEVGAVIQTGRAVEPNVIIGQITRGFYDGKIGAELQIPVRDIPDIKAELQLEPGLIRVSVRERDVARGRDILNALFKQVGIEVDKMAALEVGRADGTLEVARNKLLNAEIDGDKATLAIEADRAKLKIAEQRLAGLQAGRSAAKARADEADALRWDEKIEAERMDIETLTRSLRSDDLELRKNQNALNSAKVGVKLAEDMRNRMGYVRMEQEPTPSAGPVAPNKRQTVVIGGFLGICLALGIAFLHEYLGRKKKAGLPRP